MRELLIHAAVLAAMVFPVNLARAETELDVLGDRPAYSDRTLSAVPNAQAIDSRIWVPGLDRGYIPQGLTIIGDALFLGTYQSVDPKKDRGPCRLYRINPTSGAVTGSMDLPPACGHAGGLARGAVGHLWVIDTRAIFEIALSSPTDTGIGRIVRTIKLGGNVRGSFGAESAGALWLGTYATSGSPRLHQFPLNAIKDELTDADATASLPIPLNAQGAAFDNDGQLWITRSGSKFGELMRLDPTTGAVLAKHAMPAGVEDISFASSRHLWAVSEAGSQRWLEWSSFYPVLFRVDVTKLNKD